MLLFFGLVVGGAKVVDGAGQCECDTRRVVVDVVEVDDYVGEDWHGVGEALVLGAYSEAVDWDLLVVEAGAGMDAYPAGVLVDLEEVLDLDGLLALLLGTFGLERGVDEGVLDMAVEAVVSVCGVNADKASARRCFVLDLKIYKFIGCFSTMKHFVIQARLTSSSLYSYSVRSKTGRLSLRSMIFTLTSCSPTLPCSNAPSLATILNLASFSVS